MRLCTMAHYNIIMHACSVSGVLNLHTYSASEHVKLYGWMYCFVYGYVSIQTESFCDIPKLN